MTSVPFAVGHLRFAPVVSQWLSIADLPFGFGFRVYSYWWEGKACTSLADGGWGFTYLQIFLLDAALGAVFLLILPFAKTAAPEQN